MIWGIFSIGIGLIILIIIIFNVSKNNKIIKNGVHVTGVLVDYKEQETENSSNNAGGTGVSFGVGNYTYNDRINYQILYSGVYEYVVNGFKYYICNETYTAKKKPLGSTADIYYLNNSPEQAVIKSKGENVFLVVLSLVFIGVGIFVLLMK